MIQLILGFMAALSAVLAFIASHRIDPIYSWIIKLDPVSKQLHSTRELIDTNQKILIRNDNQEELDIIHQTLVEEHDFYEQYFPVAISFQYQGLKLEYADRRTKVLSNTPGIRNELIEDLDSRISSRITHVAYLLNVLCLVCFLALILLSIV